MSTSQKGCTDPLYALQADHHAALQLVWKAWQAWQAFCAAQHTSRHQLAAALQCWQLATQRAVWVQWEDWQQVMYALAELVIWANVQAAWLHAGSMLCYSPWRLTLYITHEEQGGLMRMLWMQAHVLKRQRQHLADQQQRRQVQLQHWRLWRQGAAEQAQQRVQVRAAAQAA